MDIDIRAVERGEPPGATPIAPAAARYPYRSWPDRSELRQFRDEGLVFWRRSDFHRSLRFDDVLDGGQLVLHPSRALHGPDGDLAVDLQMPHDVLCCTCSQNRRFDTNAPSRSSDTLDIFDD